MNTFTTTYSQNDSTITSNGNVGSWNSLKYKKYLLELLFEMIFLILIIIFIAKIRRHFDGNPHVYEEMYLLILLIIY